MNTLPGRWPIGAAPVKAIIACCAAGRGTTSIAAAVCRVGTSIFRTTGTTFTVFGFRRVIDSLYFYAFTLFNFGEAEKNFFEVFEVRRKSFLSRIVGVTLSHPVTKTPKSMTFYPGTIFHIYNQGNNRQPVFFSEENYLFFLRKMRKHLLPYGDFLAYCLMPNHFHWLFYVRQISVGVTGGHPDTSLSPIDGVTGGHPVNKRGHADNKREVSLNESIGILLRSYTRAINKQENRSGALFREETKAKDGWIPPLITDADYKKFRFGAVNDYGYQCFCYIHDNPKEANLASKSEDWPYSSARDYAGLRKGTLCNMALAKELLNLP